MKNATIYGDFMVMEVITYNDIIVAIGCDDNGEVFYRLSASDDLIDSGLSDLNEFFYNKISDMINDINEVISYVENNNQFDDNTKNHLIYNFTMVIKIIGVLCR